jgi:peptidoglycan/LPS O-acetylase OafA/YrhL
VPFGQTRASVLLDLLRGLAALLVLLEHWRNLLFCDYRQVPSHKVLWIPAYLLTAAGHQAVVIFFVLSGYLIGGSIFRALAQGRWSWASYATHRLVRLWVVILPGLVLCTLCDTLGMKLHRAPELYGGLSSNHMTPNVLATLTPRAFLGNLLFLQGVRVPMYGSDGALWSLANEFWYYVLFPVAVFAARRGSIWRRVGWACLFLAVCWFVKLPILIGFPTWLMGVALLRLGSAKADDRLRWALGTGYALLVFFLARFRPLQNVWGDLLLGVATVVLLRTLLSATEKARSDAAWVRWSRFLARGSFTLYVVHTPVLVLLTSLIVGDGKYLPSFAHIGVALLALVFTVVLAYALAYVTEFRTDRIRAWVEQELGLRA